MSKKVKKFNIPWYCINCGKDFNKREDLIDHVCEEKK